MVDNTNPQAPINLIKQGVAVGAVKSVTPRTDMNQNEGSEIAIIRGLGSDEYIREAYLLLKGFMFDFVTNKWVQFRHAIMNDLGIGNMVTILHSISKIDFSNLEEKRIPTFIYSQFAQQYTHFAIYAGDFELADHDLNTVKAILWNRLLSAHYNAKNAGHRNVVRGTLSEQVFLKSLGEAQNKKPGLLSRIFNRGKSE